jgi:hypothetical protein
MAVRAEGLTESMINRLSRIRDLTAMSREKKRETDAIEQRRQVKVDAILTASPRCRFRNLDPRERTAKLRQ